MKNWKTIAAVAALLAGATWAQSSNAGVVISDNFDSDTAVLDWGGDSVFLSIPQPGDVPGQPSVDLVGVGDGFGSLAFSGNSVDLDGTTGGGFSPSGEIQSVTSLGTGNYTVQFELAGNLRGAPVQTLSVAIGSQVQNLSVPANYPYTLTTLHFTGASGQVSFTDSGPATQEGNLIDNITVASVPEPTIWAMLILGMGSMGAVLRRRRNLGLGVA